MSLQSEKRGTRQTRLRVEMENLNHYSMVGLECGDCTYTPQGFFALFLTANVNIRIPEWPREFEYQVTQTSITSEFISSLASLFVQII